MPQLDSKRLQALSLPKSGNDKANKRPYLELDSASWFRIIVFLLSMSAYGLEFLPALLVVFFMLIKSFVNDRHEFIVQLTLFIGGYGLYYSDPLIVRNDHLIFIVVLILALIYKKPPIVTKTFIIIISFLLAFIVIASFSEFSISSQLMTMRHYFYFIYFYIPILAFNNQEFDFRKYMEWILGYTLVLSCFYILDSFVICGHIFIPRVFDFESVFSTWDNMYIHWFKIPFRRIYPPGLYISALAIYGIAVMFRLRKWQLALLLLGIACTKTITFIVGLILTYSFLRGVLKHIFKYTLIVALALFSLYFVDKWVEENLNIKAHDFESPMRIKSTIDQIIDLVNADTIDEYAKFGSGRMAQAIPKFELMYKYDREWTGLGFLDRSKTTNTRYIIDNEFFGNPDEKTEVASGVEIAYAQTILNTGYIGLIVQLFVYLLIAYRIRRLRNFRYFQSVLFAILFFGLNGICSINNMDGLLLLSLSYAVVILTNRDNLPGFNPQLTFRSNRKGLHELKNRNDHTTTSLKKPA